MLEIHEQLEQRFVLHWGEMGVRWGINRSVAQVQALLILSEAPLTAEFISETLGIARSNVSTSLKELQNWKLVKSVHIPQDRRDHFQAISDPWELFRVVAAERKKRELDPTREEIRECLENAKKLKVRHEYTEGRLAEMLTFFDTVFAFYEQLERLDAPSMKRFAKGGAKICKVLGLTGKGQKK